MPAKRIPFEHFPKDKSMDAAPKDGVYGVISHDKVPMMNRYGFSPMNPFPWIITIYKFEDGMGDVTFTSTDPSQALADHKIDKVFLIGLSHAEQRTLSKENAKHGVELVEEVSA